MLVGVVSVHRPGAAGMGVLPGSFGSVAVIGWVMLARTCWLSTKAVTVATPPPMRMTSPGAPEPGVLAKIADEAENSTPWPLAAAAVSVALGVPCGSARPASTHH